jgi:hypothetical protein
MLSPKLWIFVYIQGKLFLQVAKSSFQDNIAPTNPLFLPPCAVIDISACIDEKPSNSPSCS